MPGGIVSGDAAPGATLPARRRRGWLIALIILLVLIMAAAIAFRPVDSAVRGYLEEQIAASLQTSLSIDPDAELEVTVGGDSVIAQLVAGELERVDVSVDRVAFGEFSGPATLAATSVPTDLSKPVGTLDIDFSITEDQLLRVSENLSGVPITDVTVDSSQIEVSAEIAAFFITVPLSVGLIPSAVDGQIAFRPDTIMVGTAEFDADDLRDRFGAIGEQALTTQNLCIAEGLPAAFVLDGVRPASGSLALHFSGDGAILTEESLARLGTCPAA